MKEQLGYITDGVEFIKTELLLEINNMRDNYINFGIGVYSDELFEQIYGRKPIKPYSERANLANCIKGVDFVFEMKDAEGEILKEPPLYVDDGSKKEFHVVYAPGSYDLLHEGHLDHLLQCRRKADILVVGVKSDANVFETKGKKTHQPEYERVRVIKNLNFVDYVFLVTTRDKHWANEMVKALVGEPIDVVMLGSDCKGQETIQNPDGLLFIFTDRDPVIAQTRSSTYYREKVEKQAQDETNE